MFYDFLYVLKPIECLELLIVYWFFRMTVKVADLYSGSISALEINEFGAKCHRKSMFGALIFETEIYVRAGWVK